MAKKRKSKLKILFILVCLIVLAIYGGIKGGEYAAKKLTKPMEKNGSIFDSLKGWTKTETGSTLSEDEMVTLTAVITEFISAEHMKKDERLTVLVDQDYYNTLLRDLKQISAGEAVVQDISFKEVENDKAEVEAKLLKESKILLETITLKKRNSVWRVTWVNR